IGNLSPAIVVSVGEKNARAYVKSLGPVQIEWDGLSWARKQLRNETPGPAPKDAGQVLAKGDVVYVVADEAGHAQLGQIPEAQSALVALDPNDGSIVALVGGFDYFTNKYNRVTQARRLPGSGTAIDYIARFGFDPRTMPHDLTLALGTLQATPLDVAAGYAVFANGGYRVTPYFIDRIEDGSGAVVWRAAPRMVCAQCDEGG